MRKFSLSLPVSAMIEKQGKHFTTAKIFKKVCKTLFVTVTILSPNLFLNDFCEGRGGREGREVGGGRGKGMEGRGREGRGGEGREGGRKGGRGGEGRGGEGREGGEG